MGIRRSEPRKFPCNCCGFWTLNDPAYGSYEICPVCFWEDDPVQNEDPLFYGGANSCSLIVARQNYINVGACEARFVDDVRSPIADEIPQSLSSPDPEMQLALTRGLKSAILNATRSILSDETDPVDGCSLIAWLASGLKEAERRSESLLIFEVVASELDDIPVGEVRKLWERDALAKKDAEASAYIERVLPQIVDACASPGLSCSRLYHS